MTLLFIPHWPTWIWPWLLGPIPHLWPWQIVVSGPIHP